MAERNTTGIFSFTSPVKFIWPHVFEPRKFMGKNGVAKGDAKYDGTLLFPPDHPDFVPLKQLAVTVAKAKWPGLDIPAAFKARELRMPWQNGDHTVERRTADLKKQNKTYDGGLDFLKGNVTIKVSSKYQPRLSIFANGRIVDLEEGTFAAHKAKFYSGVEILAQVNLVPYDKVGEEGKDGVTAYLNLVFSTGKGEKMGGGNGPIASEVFKGYVGTATAEDPTGGAGLDDDIPF